MNVTSIAVIFSAGIRVILVIFVVVLIEPMCIIAKTNRRNVDFNFGIIWNPQDTCGANMLLVARLRYQPQTDGRKPRAN